MSQNDQSPSFTTVYDKAVQLLAMRLHTEYELVKKLSNRKFPKQVVYEVINELKRKKFLNDETFAEIFLDNLIKYKTLGYYGLKMKLMQRGINAATIDRLLSDNFSIQEELRVAKKFADRSGKTGQKLAAALKSRGFRNDIIFKLVSEYED